MSKKIISEKTKENLEILKKAGLLDDFYLAGGTGLALQLEHRTSIDLDFFSRRELDNQALLQKIKKLGDFSLEKEAENTLTGIFNNTKITFLTYDYPRLFPFKEINNIKVADIKDIVCMKISAISSRGSKKDFIDLFFICQQDIPLEEILKLFEKKYESVDYNITHILKSLLYFKDAEKEPMPVMLVPVEWGEIKDFFKRTVAKYNQ
jgi:predicted nucleotidyltransferase component of viral defense system